MKQERPAAKLMAKRALAALWPKAQTSSPRRVILLYHSVGDTPLALSDSLFRKQMEWLASAAAVRPLVPLLRSAGPERLQAAITFDDGYSSVYSHAFPILRELDVPAAIFVNSGHIEDELDQPADAGEGHYPGESFLLWRELAELGASGWTVGSHGVRHLDLTKEPDEGVRSELTKSRATIEQKLGTCSPVFAYTWGRHTARLRCIVKEVGYSHALAGIHGSLSADMDPFAIPRIAIARDYTLSDFKAIIEGDWDYLQWLQRFRLRRAEMAA